jgi:undecaprenyl-diphosphatase
MGNYLINPNNYIFSSFLILVGLIFFMAGLLHKVPTIHRLDKDFFLSLHTPFRKYSSFYIHLWHLGTTPVALVLISMLFIVNTRTGLIVLIFYGYILITEKIFKKIVSRNRPFTNTTGALLVQPTQPKDSSFPSGDAMRISFLALSIPYIFNLYWIALPVIYLLALVLCSNRIALGVHYPLDVLSGMGLGIIGAGCVIHFI